MSQIDALQLAWTPRLRSAALAAWHKALRDHPGDTYNARLEAVDAAEALMFDSEAWSGIPATGISDVAYEIVHTITPNA